MYNVARQASQMGGYIAEQMRMRPLIVGSVMLGLIGAIAGAWMAQMRAMRRRKSMYERAMDTLADIGTIISGLVYRKPKGPIETLRERGQEVASTTRMLGMMGVTPGGIPRAKVTRGPERMVRQAGYAISLIPVTVTLLRNPLVRDLGIRILSRRVTGR